MHIANFVAALDTVAQDHQLLLDRMEALKEMVACLAEPENFDPPKVFGRLRDLDKYFITQFTTHMDEEETMLFPLLEQFPPEGGALAECLRQEHEVLRRALADFDSGVGVALDLQDRPPAVLLRDLLMQASELWELLDKHAHAETQGVHDCLKRQLLRSR